MVVENGLGRIELHVSIAVKSITRFPYLDLSVVDILSYVVYEEGYWKMGRVLKRRQGEKGSDVRRVGDLKGLRNVVRREM
jgi:hypothetical protein